MRKEHMNSIKKNILMIGIFIGGLLIGISITYILPWAQTSNYFRPPLRERTAYDFINPLLICDARESQSPMGSEHLKSSIESYIDQAKKNGAIDSTSIYFRNFNTSEWLGINPNEQFSLASLGKVPVMIAYLKLADANPDILKQKLKYTGTDDLNIQQEISPEQAIVPNTSYTIAELIERMILYSDNNATMALYQNLNKTLLQNVYTDLNIDLSNSFASQSKDFITAHEYASFYRVLYNATYLSKPNSEKALGLLTETNFSKGLIANIPKGTKVAHKFGLTTFTQDGIVQKRELHECGIFYTQKTPYLLCIMTKSHGSLEAIEDFIAQTSHIVFENIATNSN